jgi:hypothetical protein
MADGDSAGNDGILWFDDVTFWDCHADDLEQQSDETISFIALLL